MKLPVNCQGQLSWPLIAVPLWEVICMFVAKVGQQSHPISATSMIVGVPSGELCVLARLREVSA